MNKKLIIETLTKSDLESISNTLENDFDNFWNYNILSKELDNPSSVYLCCKLNNEVIGFAGITIILDTAEINIIVIKKKYRGNGYSSMLLDRLINLAKSKECKKINLEVASSNTIAIQLYKKFGFEQVGIRRGYYNGTDALLFTL